MAQSPPSRVWSLNTSYTGAAGIHSELGPGASARNILATRRVSTTMTTEETILKKQMHSFDTSKKSLESSMLVYSQKMKIIAEKKRSEAALAEETEQNTLVNAGVLNPSSTKEGRKEGRKSVNVYGRNTALPAVSDFIPESSIQHGDKRCSKLNSHASESGTDVSSRMSIDSGISVDMRSESSDTFPDSYCSDADTQRWGRRSTGTDVQVCENSKQYAASGVFSGEQGNQNRPKHGRERRSRITAEKTELAAIIDTEISPDLGHDTQGPSVPAVGASAELSEKPSCDGTSEDSVVISAFPESNSERLVPRLCLDTITEDKEDWSETRVLNPLSKTGYMRYKSSAHREIPQALAKPKATNSPSLSSIRVRRRASKAKVVTKPFHQSFKYSEAVETAIKSSQEPSPSNQSPTLPNIDLDELRQSCHLSRSLQFMEKNPEFKLYRERCLSSSPLSSQSPPPPPLSLPQLTKKRASFISSLESVDEHESVELRSVLKGTKNSVTSNREKKSVNFFLPDIRKKPNTMRRTE